ncbi:DUF3458 domain-containing protein, partial [Psychrobacter sp. 1Y1]|uniref:DUF3458 domain-containing protein n=1 Tax=Psychrobacter sp. 1Y1 TaxID=3453574 RepID=UPI003F46409E
EHYDAANNSYKLTLSQSTPDTPGQTDKQPLHIPFDVEMISAHGDSVISEVLNFTDKQQTFTFSGMTSKPIPSLLQNFSAPVKLSFDYSIEQLVHIMRFATSEVAKWEASVSLFSQSVWQNVERLQHKQAMFIDPRILDAFKGVILAQDLDKALMAEILTLPSAGSLIEQKSAVDLDNLALAREFV